MTNTFFKWDEYLMTGYEKIDQQHKGLIHLINDALQLCFNSTSISKEKVESLFSELLNYTVEHFETEKKIMMEYNIDWQHTVPHFEAHEEFGNKIKWMSVKADEYTDVKKLTEVIEFLIRWLAYHILNMDKSLIRQVDAIRSGKLSPSLAFNQEEVMNENNTEPLLKALKSLFYLVSEKNKELSEANRMLEFKVKERTKALEDANNRLETITMIDELTKLWNRRYAFIELERLVSNYKRYHTEFSILFLDLDNFKGVNDQYGHEQGDLVLKWVASYLEKNLRKGDIPCRLGGDEFVIICTNCDENAAFELGCKLINQLGGEVSDEIKAIWKPSFSIGVAEFDERIDSQSNLLKKADDAMYQSKQNGRNTVQKYSDLRSKTI